LSKSLGFYELMEKVVETGICSGCGACVAVCPFKDVLEYADERPILIGECKNCGICVRVCPRYNVQVDELDKLAFGRLRTPDEVFGVYKSIYASRSLDGEILEKGQDGGVATTILKSALESGLIDGAIVSGVNSSTPWLPTPLVARSGEEVLLSAGTRYSYSPNLTALKKAVDEGLKRIAFVGTPCQILAVRRMQKANIKKFTNPIVFTIGLFCSESFSYPGLMVEKIQEGFGIDLMDVAKINIKGRMLVYLKNGDVVKIPLKEIREYANPRCSYCDDFSAELADISLGGIGLNDWNLTIVRTDRGREVFDQVVKGNCLEVKSAEKMDKSLKLLKQLSIMKRRNFRRVN
jgi:coenzyme F420 hydrogenase subunit beta